MDIKAVFKYSQHNDTRRKVAVAEGVCYMALICLVLYGIKAYLQGFVFYAFIHVITIIITLGTFIWYKLYDAHALLLMNINIIFTLFLTYMIFTGGTGYNSGLIWFQLFPLLTFAINGLLLGTVMTVVFTIIGLVATLCTDLPFVTHEYPMNITYNFYGTFVFIVSMSFVSEYSLTIASMKEEKFKLSLMELSQKDDLTGIYNRRYMNDVIKDLFDNNKEFTIAFADIDNFKLINDNYGHASGDAVIKEIANVFKNLLRSNDYISRWGGEEFVLVFPNLSEKETRIIVERIRKQIEDTIIETTKGSLNVTCSFGIQNSIGKKSDDDVINSADSKLYEAKKNGRNRIVS